MTSKQTTCSLQRRVCVFPSPLYQPIADPLLAHVVDYFVIQQATATQLSVVRFRRRDGGDHVVSAPLRGFVDECGPAAVPNRT